MLHSDGSRAKEARALQVRHWSIRNHSEQDVPWLSPGRYTQGISKMWAIILPILEPSLRCQMLLKNSTGISKPSPRVWSSVQEVKHQQVLRHLKLPGSDLRSYLCLCSAQQCVQESRGASYVDIHPLSVPKHSWNNYQVLMKVTLERIPELQPQQAKLELVQR